MTKEEQKAAFKAAVAKIPGLPNLDFMLERMPSEEEFQKTLAESCADIEAEFQAGLDFDIDESYRLTPGPDESHRSVPAQCLTKSKRISLRVPSPVLAACRAQAKLRGTKYQTFINRMLREAAASWVAPVPHV